MSDEPRFEKAFPYQEDILALPVADLDVASGWYGEHFGMTEVERCDEPVPAAILVSNVEGLKDELQSRGVDIGNWRVDERDGKKYQVFFVVAPDGLCFYFHEPVEGDA